MPFSQIAERVSTYGRSGALPGVEFEDIISGEGCLNKNLSQKQCTKDGKLFQEGDVLFGKLRPYLRNIILANFKGVAIGDFWVLRGNESTHSFLYYLINSEAFIAVANVTSGSKMPRADWGYVSSAAFSLPSLPEQTTIANFFTHLDTLIASTSRRLEKLRAVKTAALQTLFPQEGEKEPRVRFKGFSGEWKEVKLGECLEICNERNSDCNYGHNQVLSVSEEAGVVNQIDLLGRSYAGKSVANYKILRPGQIVYTKSPLKAKPYGIVKVNKEETGIVSVLYAVYNAKENISADYIHYYFAPAFRLNNYLSPLVEKGAKNTMNISDSTALDGLVFIPPTLPEQTAIANYFTHLDTLIASTSRRLDKLRAVKSACLEGMFV